MFINAMVTQGARSLAGMIFAPQASHLNVSLREDFNSLCLQTPHSIYDQSSLNTGSDNGLLPACHQAITWINAGLLSTGPCEQISLNQNAQILYDDKVVEMLYAKCQPFCSGFSVFNILLFQWWEMTQYAIYVTVALLPDAVWPGESSGNSCLC